MGDDCRDGRVARAIACHGRWGRRPAAVTRRKVLLGGGSIGAGLAVAGIVSAATGRSPASGQAIEEIRAIVDTAATLEALEVTLIGVARQRAAQGQLDLGAGADVVRYLRAAQCQEEAHFYFLDGEGAVPATSEFSFPDRVFRSRSAFLRTLLELEGIELGLYLAAARAFARLGELRLVEVAYQTGAVEGQHYALLKGFLNEFPPNDRAFAQWRYPDVAAAGAAIVATGFLDADGEPRYEFPGPVERFCRGVFGLVPATTETEAPEAAGTPVA